MIRLSPKLWIVLAVFVLMAVVGPGIMSAAYNNVGSILLSKRLKVAEGAAGSADLPAAHDQEAAFFAKAIDWNNSNSRSYHNLGIVFSLLGDNRRAASFLAMAADLGSDEPLARLRLAQVYDRLGLTEEAIREFERAAPSRDDLLVTYLVDSSPGYLELGGGEDLEARIQRRRYGPGWERLLSGYLGVAGGLLRHGDDASAGPLLEKALRLDPKNRSALYHLALIYSRTSSEEKIAWAADTLRKLPYLDPSESTDSQLQSVDREIGSSLGTSEYNVQFYLALARSLVARLGSAANQTEARYLIGRYLHRAGERQHGLRQYQDILQSGPSSGLSPERLGQMYYALAVDYQERGDVDRAVEYYQLALQRNERMVEANRRLRDLYVTKGMSTQASALDVRLANLAPAHRLNQGQGIRVGDKALLLGFDFDEDDLDIGAEIQVSLYWQLSQGLPPSPKARLYPAGDKYVEVRMVRNAVPNGGFEWDKDLRGMSYPYGWPLPIMDAPSQPPRDYFKTLGYEYVCCQPRREKRFDRETTVLRLLPTEAYPRERGLESFEVPVLPNRYYLLGAWLRSDGGSGHLAQYWRSEWEAGASEPYRFVDPGVAHQGWQYHAGIIRQPNAADSARVRLFNYGGSPGGSVYADDVLLFEVEPPG